jgi:hypothetical protein
MSLALSALMSGDSNIFCSCSISSVMPSTSMRHNIRLAAWQSSVRHFARCDGSLPAGVPDRSLPPNNPQNWSVWDSLGTEIEPYSS